MFSRSRRRLSAASDPFADRAFRAVDLRPEPNNALHAELHARNVDHLSRLDRNFTPVLNRLRALPGDHIFKAVLRHGFLPKVASDHHAGPLRQRVTPRPMVQGWQTCSGRATMWAARVRDALRACGFAPRARLRPCKILVREMCSQNPMGTSAGLSPPHMMLPEMPCAR